MSLINESINNLKMNNKKQKKISGGLVILVGGFSLILLAGASLFIYSINHKINMDFFSWVTNITQKQKLIHLPDDTKVEYYNAINILNDGKADEASVILKNIMEKNPDFRPVKTLYNGLRT